MYASPPPILPSPLLPLPHTHAIPLSSLRPHRPFLPHHPPPNPLLTHHPPPRHRHHQRLHPQNHRQRHHRANHARHRFRHAPRRRRIRRRARRGVRPRHDRRRARPRAVPARTAPLRLAADSESVHRSRERLPREIEVRLREERIRDRVAGIGCRAVVEQKAHVDVVGAGERGGGRVRRQFERHGRGVVGHAVEVGVRLREVGKAEEGLEGAVGAELEVQFAAVVAADGRVEGLQDLGGEGGAGDSADGGGGVEGQGVFVRVGEGAEVEEGGVCEEGGVV